MCDPVTIGTIAAIGSSVVGAVGSYQQGQAAKRSADYNAALDLQNAELQQRQKATVDEQLSIDNRRLGEQKRAAIGDLNAKAGAAGVDPGFGSAADLVGDTTQGYRIDQGILLKNAYTNKANIDANISNYTSDAALKTMQGKDAATAGLFSAGASLLSGASTVAGKWKPSSSKSPWFTRADVGA